MNTSKIACSKLLFDELGAVTDEMYFAAEKLRRSPEVKRGLETGRSMLMQFLKRLEKEQPPA